MTNTITEQPTSPTLTTIKVAGRRWFQRSYGNTYHSVEVTAVFADGSTKTLRSGKRYGYGDHYIQTAVELLTSYGVLVGDVTQFLPLSLYCREHGLSYVHTVLDVPRERDLDRVAGVTPE